MLILLTILIVWLVVPMISYAYSVIDESSPVHVVLNKKLQRRSLIRLGEKDEPFSIEVVGHGVYRRWVIDPKGCTAVSAV